tara:strand:+ start:420 stop:878 length:459 start_codon:yes stop_codon:yes gene_type:complete
MRLLGNIFWFLLGGWLLFLFYFFAACIFFPVFIPLFRLAMYSLWPFGKDVVTQQQLRDYREASGSEAVEVFTTLGGLLNLIWMLTFGWILALAHLASSIVNLLFFWLIVTIPNIAGHWKMIRVAFMPFDKVIVPTLLAEEIEKVIAKRKLNL